MNRAWGMSKVSTYWMILAQKAAEAIREVVGMAILAELNDPRIRDVTVSYNFV